ncbi:MAG TPA: cytochrome c biogenesis protein CcdA, partial [Pyrinomonadaceae bacterium]|nr:cytochrome c biogenesis protein CcdA [Pyrinomonadaceae bacterium]
SLCFCCTLGLAMEGSNITILIAFAAGLLSFLTPCVLPLVPGYISLISGVSVEHLKGEGGASRVAARRAVVLNSLAFNAGLSLIFVSLGAAAGYVGATVLSNPWLRIIGGLVIIAFGLQLMGVLKIGALYRDTRKFSDEKPRGMLGSLTLGIAFAAGWTPCIGPILGGIIGLAATSGGWKSGLILSSFYAAGLAIPFLVVGLLLNQFLGFYGWFRRHLHKVEVVSGVMLIAIGLLVAFNFSTVIANLASRSGFNPEAWVQGWARKDDAPGTSAAGTQTTTSADATAQPGGASAPGAANNNAFEPAPEFEAQTLSGQPFKLSELRGRVVLLNFWATWCGPCRNEIPQLNAMHRDLEARGLSVVGITTYDDAEGVGGFQKDIPQDYRVVTAAEDVASKYGVVALPTTFVIDRDGRVRAKIIGERDRAGFEREVLPLLGDAGRASNAGEAAH